MFPGWQQWGHQVPVVQPMGFGAPYQQPMVVPQQMAFSQPQVFPQQLMAVQPRLPPQPPPQPPPPPGVQPPGLQQHVSRPALPPEPPKAAPPPPPPDPKLNALAVKAQMWQHHKQQTGYNNAEILNQRMNEVTQEEKDFDKQYKDWLKQYEDWKQQNKNHPNREQFLQYEKQWMEYKKQMDEKQQEILTKKKQILDEINGKVPASTGYGADDGGYGGWEGQDPWGQGGDVSGAGDDMDLEDQDTGDLNGHDFGAPLPSRGFRSRGGFGPRGGAAFRSRGAGGPRGGGPRSLMDIRFDAAQAGGAVSTQYDSELDAFGDDVTQWSGPAGRGQQQAGGGGAFRGQRGRGSSRFSDYDDGKPAAASQSMRGGRARGRAHAQPRPGAEQTDFDPWRAPTSFDPAVESATAQEEQVPDDPVSRAVAAIAAHPLKGKSPLDGQNDEFADQLKAFDNIPNRTKSLVDESPQDYSEQLKAFDPVPKELSQQLKAFEAVPKTSQPAASKRPLLPLPTPNRTFPIQPGPRTGTFDEQLRAFDDQQASSASAFAESNAFGLDVEPRSFTKELAAFNDKPKSRGDLSGLMQTLSQGGSDMIKDVAQELKLLQDQKEALEKLKALQEPSSAFAGLDKPRPPLYKAAEASAGWSRYDPSKGRVEYDEHSGFFDRPPPPRLMEGHEGFERSRDDRYGYGDRHMSARDYGHPASRDSMGAYERERQAYEDDWQAHQRRGYTREQYDQTRRDRGRDPWPWERDREVWSTVTELTERERSYRDRLVWEKHERDRRDGGRANPREHRPPTHSEPPRDRQDHRDIARDTLYGRDREPDRRSRDRFAPYNNSPSSRSHAPPAAPKPKEKEVAAGGSAPRMLCLDDYFMTEIEKMEKDADTGKVTKRIVLEYEYEAGMEETYRKNLLKSFKKQIDNQHFDFLILDAVNDRVKYFDEFWSYAKTKGFQIYVAEVMADAQTCAKRNIHDRKEDDIAKIIKSWEETPAHMIRLDIRSLLQDAAIEEVEMEDTHHEDTKAADDDKATTSQEEESNDSQDEATEVKSKWETDISEERLDKLDGLRLKRKHSDVDSLADYLQLPDDYETRTSEPGKKRVRWADVAERAKQIRQREIGFVVGQTQHDWERITDDDFAEKALNRTKFI